VQKAMQERQEVNESDDESTVRDEKNKLEMCEKQLREV
jgi:hypothetical protein